MQSDLTLDEMLKSVFSSLADEIIAKPKRSGKPIADPALWRALENQDRSILISMGLRSHVPFDVNPPGRA